MSTFYDYDNGLYSLDRLANEFDPKGQSPLLVLFDGMVSTYAAGPGVWVFAVREPGQSIILIRVTSFRRYLELIQTLEPLFRFYRDAQLTPAPEPVQPETQVRGRTFLFAEPNEGGGQRVVSHIVLSQLGDLVSPDVRRWAASARVGDYYNTEGKYVLVRTS
jgi:hypothetical protein